MLLSQSVNLNLYRVQSISFYVTIPGNVLALKENKEDCLQVKS
jgi:hypothetical protein